MCWKTTVSSVDWDPRWRRFWLDWIPLARLSAEDQRFVHAFLRHHGSIKKMESLLGVSYPTVKNRLNSITAELDSSFGPTESNAAVLERLAKGEITVQQALDTLE